jgi:hypothetical protein
MRSGITIRRHLPRVNCPVCYDVLQARPGGIVKAQSWLDCLRRCLKCEVGFSNARTNPTVIFNDPLMNIPQQVQEGLLETLGSALNERNLTNKKTKVGFSTSEDALTWTVFKYLSDSGQLMGVLRQIGLPITDRATSIEALLLWGVPIPIEGKVNNCARRLRKRLEAISDQLGEDPRSRTEPDVVIDLGRDGVLIIEVKHRSGTDVKAGDYVGWDRYYPTSSPLPYASSMRGSFCYELARNWRFGLELAAKPSRPFTLACLGPDELFCGEGARIIRPFEACLPMDGTARFQKLRWGTLLGAISKPPRWLVQYVESRNYTILTEGQ